MNDKTYRRERLRSWEEKRRKLRFRKLIVEQLEDRTLLSSVSPDVFRDRRDAIRQQSVD